MNIKKTSYSEGILEAFNYLLENHSDVFVIGQGLWSPWYVGNSMKDLDKKFGKERVIDTPVSEDATTAIAGGASLCGFRPIVVHPRVDFMVLACNSLVNQIAKWSHMLGGQSHPSVTVRAIINRGGEQGAQHSQSLHSWFAHIPGLRVVMPATAKDARDLLVASVLCDDPVLYIDDRWCYEEEDELGPIEKISLSQVKPQLLRSGTDLTLVASGYSSVLAKQVADLLLPQGVTCDVIDLRVVNPIDFAPIMNSVEKTNRLAVIDGSWKNCGLGGEVIASVVEKLPCNLLKSRPARFSLPAAPAPTSKPLEKDYYPTATGISQQILENFF